MSFKTMLNDKNVRYAIAISAVVTFLATPLINQMVGDISYRVRQGMRTYDHYDYEVMIQCANETDNFECCFGNVMGSDRLTLDEMVYNCAMVIPYR